MDKKIIDTPGVYSFTHHGFANCVSHNGVVYLTGQAGIDEQGKLVSKDIIAQSHQAFSNIKNILWCAGSHMDAILSMTCFIVDLKENGPVFWQIRKEYLPHPTYTSASIGIDQLAVDNMLIEIQCCAAMV